MAVLTIPFLFVRFAEDKALREAENSQHNAPSFIFSFASASRVASLSAVPSQTNTTDRPSSSTVSLFHIWKFAERVAYVREAVSQLCESAMNQLECKSSGEVALHLRVSADSLLESTSAAVRIFSIVSIIVLRALTVCYVVYTFYASACRQNDLCMIELLVYHNMFADFALSLIASFFRFVGFNQPLAFPL